MTIKPIGNISELPNRAQRFPKGAQRAYMHGFNSALSDTGEEGRAFSMGQISSNRWMESNKDKHNWVKASDGRWHPKEY